MCAGRARDAAAGALAERGLLADGEATEEGKALRARIEQLTDELAAPPYDVLDAPEALHEALVPAAMALANEMPFPNPIGLPRLRRS